jgi:hypothetical protein
VRAATTLPHRASFDQDATFKRRVVVNVSADGGMSFSPAIDPGHGIDTSDPVVEVSGDVGFAVASLKTGFAVEPAVISKSVTERPDPDRFGPPGRR